MRNDRADVLRDLAGCCSESHDRRLSGSQDLIDMFCRFSDGLSCIGDIAFDFADRAINGRNSFANFGQEVADFERFFASEGVSRRGHTRGSDIDQQVLVS